MMTAELIEALADKKGFSGLSGEAKDEPVGFSAALSAGKKLTIVLLIFKNTRS
jgi:hypothetical protein